MGAPSEPPDETETASVQSLLHALLQKHATLEDSIRRIEQLLDPGQPDEPPLASVPKEFEERETGDTLATPRPLTPKTPAPRNVLRELSALEHEETNMVSHVIRWFWPTWCSYPSSLLKYSTVENVVAFAILLNAVTIGVQIDLQLRGQSDGKVNDILQVVNWGCVILFVVELAARIWKDGRSFCASSNPDRGWNLFDLTTVVCSAIELVLQLVSQVDLPSLSFLRVLRILRFVKATRVIRVLPVFRELRVMIAGVLKCSKSLLWAFFLMVLTTYVYAILVGHACVTWGAGSDLERKNAMMPNDHKDACDFGSMIELMYILFKCTTGGLSWGEFSDLLIPVSRLLVVAFCGYIMIFMFVIINVITAVFVEAAFCESHDPEAAAMDAVGRRRRWLQQVRDVFVKYDIDADGKLDIDEVFSSLVERATGRGDMKSLGIDVDFTNLHTLRDILDKDRDGMITLAEFADGLAGLTSQARAADLMLLRRDIKWMIKHMQQTSKDVRLASVRSRNRTAAPQDAADLEGRQGGIS